MAPQPYRGPETRWSSPPSKHEPWKFTSYIVPRQLRDELFDYLSEQTDLVSGFTASDAAGHGPEVLLHTAAERVKGHADQVVVRVIISRMDAGRLLDRLRGSFAGTRLVYWFLPVTEFSIID